MTRRVRGICGTILLLAGWLVSEPARGAEHHVEITPFAGLRSGASLDAALPGDAGAEADPALSWGLSVGWWVRPDAWFEVLFDRQSLEFRPAAGSGGASFDIDVDYLQLGGGYEPPRQGLRPYVTTALGIGRYGSSTGSVDHSTGLSGSIGGGFTVPMGKRAVFRLEARGWGIVTDGAAEVVCGPGCSFSFSGSGSWQVGLRAGVAFCPSGRP